MKRSSTAFAKAIVYLFAFTALLNLASFAQVQTQKTVTENIVNGRIGGYLESLPVTYNSQPAKKFPLLIFVHGKGEMGDGSAAALDRVAANGPPRLIKEGKFPSSFTVNGENFSFIVVSPQISANNYLQAANFMGQFLDYCKKKYRVDEERIYITGLSMGGGITWGALTVHAPVFAAAVPICGAYGLSSTGAKLMADSKLPVWCTHNSGDPTVSVDVTKKWYNALVTFKADPAPKMTIFNSNSHDAWSKTYDIAYKEDGKNVYEWMLSYKRGDAVVTPLPPVASAGADQTITLPTNTVTLNAGGSTAPAGTIKTYAWTKTSGPSQGSITSATAVSTTVTGLVEGSYIFQVKITDSNGNTATDDVIVTVKPAPLPPVANAGSAQSITLPVNTVTLDGSKSSAPSGTIKTYQWSKISGPAQGTITSAAASTTTVTGMAEGVYTFELKITDSNNKTATATVSVTVYAAPVPPVANAGSDQELDLPNNTTTLDGSKSTASSGSITGYQWAKLSGPAQGTLSNATQATATLTGLVEGVYEYQLKVTDSKGNTATATVTVTVNAAKVPPTADAGSDQLITLPLNEVSLSGAASKAAAGRTISQYQWTQTAGSSGAAIATATAVNTVVKPLAEGVYVYELKVTDDLGLSSTASVTVTVKAAPVPPVANAGSNQTITLPLNTVSLDGAKSTAATGNIKTYAWSKKSGPAQLSIVNPSAAKTDVNNLAEGVYEFELQVTDENGLSSAAVVTITVKAALLPPVANAGDDVVLVLPVATVTLDGSKSNAPSGTITTYSWKQTSGPAGAVIATANKAQTEVTGLTAGIYEFELTVTDNNGGNATDLVTVKVVSAPVANAGEDKSITLPLNEISLDGAGSVIPSGSTVTYVWTKLSGPSAGTLTGATEAVATVKGMAEGEYEFQLVIKDQYGNSSSDKVLIKVLPEPQAPVANAGTNQVLTLPANTAVLNGELSSGAAEIVSYSWKKVSGPAAGSIADATAAKTDVNDLTEGLYEFELTVTDKNGLTATASVTINVQPQPLPPAVEAGDDQTISLPESSVVLTGSASGTIVTYTWTRTSGAGDVVIGDADKAVATISNLKEGVYEFELKVTDNNGLSATDVVTVTVNAAALPPLANAGSAQTITLPLNEITLDGSLSTAPAGTIEKYEWIKISGPDAGVIQADNAVTTIVSDLEAGVYKYQLKVTDNNGATSTASVTVTVKAAPLPPVANAGTAQTITLPLNTVELDGSKSTAPSGTIATYEWTKVSGAAGEEWVNADKEKATVNNLSEGVYQFELKVTDNNGATSTASVTITVKAAPQPPVANAGSAQTITLPVNTVELNGNNSTAASGTIVKYEWSTVAGPGSEEIVSPAASTTTVSQLQEGVYTFELKVTDSNGAEATASVTVTVKAAPLPPVANAGADIVIVLPVNTTSLNGSKSKAPSGSITSYYWTKVSGTAGATINNANSVTATANGLLEGLYEFALEVTDNLGAKHSDTVKVTVLPQPLPPVADAGKDTTIRLPLNSIALDGSKSSSAVSTIETFNWKQLTGPSSADINDATQATTHADNLTAGVYQFELTITDKNGLTSAATVSVTVKPALIAPVAKAGADQEITLPVNTVSLDGSQSADQDGTIITYKWTKISGPSAGSIQNSNSAVTNLVNLAQGKYVYELTVTDNDGQVTKSRVTITVNAAPALPVANAGSSITITLPVDHATLDGSRSSAPAGSITSYSWQKLSGPEGSVIDNAGNAVTQVTALVAGIYEFELAITDNNGATAKATVSVVVNAAPVPPVANAGNAQTITLPVNTVTLNGTKSSASGSIEKYEWTRISGPSGGTINKPAEATTTVTGLTEGVYQFQLKVTDDKGLTATAVVNITVKPAPLPPVANAGISQVITLPVNSVTLDGSQSFGVSASLAKYEWTVSRGPAGAVLANQGNAVTDVNGLKEGQYEFVLKVTDQLGNVATASVVVEVKPEPATPPVAIAGDNFTAQLPANNMQLDGSQSYANDGATIVSYAWTKVSGPNPLTIINSGTARPTVIASEPGNYLFRLTVTDSRGLVSYDDIVVTILPKAEEQPLPVAYAGETVVLTLPDNSTQLNGWASYSEYGEIVRYSWKLLNGPAQPVIDDPSSDVINVSGLIEGEYDFELTVTDDKGKFASDTVKVVVTNAGGKQDLSSAIRIYPNPLQSIGTIEIKGAAKGRTIIDVYDAGGRRALRKEFVKNDFSATQQVDFSSLTKGVYMVEIIIDYQFRSVIKVVKN